MPGSGAVVRQVGSEGDGEEQISEPCCLCHHHVSERGRPVGDNGNYR